MTEKAVFEVNIKQETTESKAKTSILLVILAVVHIVIWI